MWYEKLSIEVIRLQREVTDFNWEESVELGFER